MVRTNASSNTVHMINQALKNVSGLINEVRSISRALMPPTLSDLGLIDSINELLDSMNRVQTFTATFTYHHVNEDNIPENQKLMLFRIIQEQFNNIIKHAKAKTVNMNLSQQTGALQLIISDDGVGFDLIQLNRGLGLTNIRNRAELFGGKVQITTAAGRGCRLVVIIPEEGNEMTTIQSSVS